MMMAQHEGAVERLPRVLIVRGSFGTLGGAERELLQLLRAVHKRWQVSLATLEFPNEAEMLLNGAKVRLLRPENEMRWPTGAWAEVTAASSKAASKAWKNTLLPWEEFDVVHLSVCKGTLELLPLIPSSLPVHYHCLEPPRWLYEDVLHRHLNGRAKRPMLLTKAVFFRQRQLDQRYVKQLLARPFASISGNSMWIQRRLKQVYNIASDPTKQNGEPPQRDALSRAIEATHLMHVIDMEAWPLHPSSEEQEANEILADLPASFVVTIGQISHVKGTWDTLHSLVGTSLALVHIGGGSPEDKDQLKQEAKRIGVELVILPRLSQNQLVAIVRAAMAVVSHARGEPFGLTPIEAMAVGTPALMVDEGGFQCTMSGIDCGRLIRRNDVNGWHQAYEEIKNPELRQQWATIGRQYVEQNFSLEVQISALESLLGIRKTE